MTDRPDTALRFYRLAVLALLVVVAILSGALLRERSRNAASTAARAATPAHSPANGAATGLRVIDLRERTAALSAKVVGVSDLAETYLATRGGAVHMHLLGAGQRIPLHIHRRTHELTAVISGRPEVVQVHGTKDGEVVTTQTAYEPGGLIYSPPFCGHAWINADARQSQANLVFSVPPFDGNFFVTPDDPRLARPTSPRTLDPEAMLAALGERAFLLQPLPVMPAVLSQLVVGSRADLRGALTARAILVLRGAVTIRSDETLRVRTDHLVIVPAHRKLEIEASEPSVMLIFRPDGR